MIMRYVFTAFICISLWGCTSPTTLVAITAMERGVEQNRLIISDFAKLAKQATIDRAASDVLAAFDKGDKPEAIKVVSRLATEWDKIGWLEKESIKVRWGLLGLVEQYLYQQKGILNILFEEWSNAKHASESQPS
jgi:hypothetical protein